jgi:hypothetical protein
VCLALAAKTWWEPDVGRRINMLWTIIVILFVMWALGLATSYTFGGFIHALLVLAVIVFLFNLLSGRRSSA